MGRYVALGIACEIQFRKSIYTKPEEFALIRKDLKNNIEKYINANDYYITEEDDSIYYRIKEEVINNNIHNLLKEIEQLFDMNDFEYHISEGKHDIKVSDENFNKDNYPLEFKLLDENYKYEGEYDKKTNCNTYRFVTPHCKIETDFPFFRENDWMLYGKGDLFDDTSGDVGYLNIWRDIDKIDGEDETMIIYILNTLLMKYFQNPLAKDLQFYISG